MDNGMRRPAGDIQGDQDGFIIIEVLVSAIILALVAGAVLTLITATTRSAASQRDRATAYDLAQADQARLRTMRITSLNGDEELNGKKLPFHEKGTTLGGTTYDVESKGVFVNNQAGGVSCTKENDSADYIQLTSTVTSPALNSPVTIQSVVSPSTGSIDPTHGTLSVETLNAAQGPVSGVSVELENTAYARTTETLGCANFADLPAGAYNIIFKGAPLVDEDGEFEEKQTGQSVSAGRSPTHAESHWETPGSIEPEFVYLEPGGTGAPQAAAVDSMVATSETTGIPKSFGKVGGPRTAKLVGEGLYPFKAAKYTVYAGYCASNNPSSTSKPENNVGLGTVEVAPRTRFPPSGTKWQIRVPALKLTVEKGAKEPVSGATVIVTDTNCKPSGTSGKRTFTTNEFGRLANPTTGLAEFGLPFGTYEVCASKTIGTKTFAAKATNVKVENFTTAGTVLSLKIVEGGSACT